MSNESKPSLLEVICDWRNWADDNPNVPNALLGSKRANRIDDAINRGDETLRQRDGLLEVCEQAEYWLEAEHNNPGQADPQEMLLVLRAAIAEAKGEGSELPATKDGWSTCPECSNTYANTDGSLPNCGDSRCAAEAKGEGS